MNETQLAVFKGRHIRRTIHHNEWWFSIVDVCAALTESSDAGAYWRKLKQRLKEEGSEVVTFCHGLKLPASDGKNYETDCANTEGIFRIIQSIPSPNAEPFKRWLAKVGYERMQEIEFFLLPLPRGGWEGWFKRQRTEINLPNPSLLRRGLKVQRGVV